VLEQPALPVELSATLELAADFAKPSKAPATQAAYGSDCRNRRAASAAVDIQPTIDAVVHLGARGAWIGGTRPTDHCSRLVANHERFKHFWE
jgi:hypothetical protein